MNTRARKITFWILFVIAVALVILNLTGCFNERQNLQIVLGLFAGAVFGVGIVGFLQTNWWLKKSQFIKLIILRLWELLILAFTISYMFPHVIREVFQQEALDKQYFLQHYYLWDAFCEDFKVNWHVYIFFIFTVIIWCLLRHIYKQGEKSTEERNNTTTYSWSLFLILIICIGFIAALYSEPITLTQTETPTAILIVDSTDNKSMITENITIQTPITDNNLIVIKTDNKTVFLDSYGNNTENSTLEETIYQITEDKTERKELSEIKIFNTIQSSTIYFIRTKNHTMLFKPVNHDYITLDPNSEDSVLQNPIVNGEVILKPIVNESKLIQIPPNEYYFFNLQYGRNPFLFWFLMGTLGTILLVTSKGNPLIFGLIMRTFGAIFLVIDGPTIICQIKNLIQQKWFKNDTKSNGNS